MVDGLSRIEIAGHLGLSANTVRTHTQNLLSKLSLHSALEAITVAMRSGMRPYLWSLRVIQATLGLCGPFAWQTVINRFSGGPGTVALNGALGLDRVLYDSTIVTGYAADDLTPVATKEGLDVVHVRSLTPRFAPRDDVAALRDLTAVLAEGKFDVVHTHDGAIGRIAAAHAATPRIVHTWHGLPFHGFQSWPRRQMYLRLERLAARHTDAFLAIGSETVRTALAYRLADAQRIRLSWPAVDTRAFTGGSRSAALALLNLPANARVVGAIGRLTFQKGPDVFVRALARLPDDVHGVWIGTGPSQNEMDRLTRRLGVGGRMHWLGHREDVPALLPALNALAMPSRWEGVPCALIEAITARVPPGRHLGPLQPRPGPPGRNRPPRPPGRPQGPRRRPLGPPHRPRPGPPPRHPAPATASAPSTPRNSSPASSTRSTGAPPAARSDRSWL